MHEKEDWGVRVSGSDCCFLSAGNDDAGNRSTQSGILCICGRISVGDCTAADAGTTGLGGSHRCFLTDDSDRCCFQKNGTAK